jgi:hypothetical protein
VPKADPEPEELRVNAEEGLAVLEELTVEMGVARGLKDGLDSAVQELVVDTVPVILAVSEELGVSEGLGVPVLFPVTEEEAVLLLELVFVRLAVWVGVIVRRAVWVFVVEGLGVVVTV